MILLKRILALSLLLLLLSHHLEISLYLYSLFDLNEPIFDCSHTEVWIAHHILREVGAVGVSEELMGL